MTEERKIQLSAGLDATGVKQGAQEAVGAVRTMGRDIKAAADEAGQSVGGVGDGASQAAGKVDKAARGIINSIERATAAAKAGERGTASYFEALGAQRGVSTDALRPYIEQLRQAEQLQQASTASLGTMAVSAGQTRAALAGVPAQLQDIVVGLQGGQAPMTVLLQQGSQLATTFGSVGGAVRGVGGFLLGLVNPFTVAAAAAAGLAAAYAVGSNEAPAYQRSIVTTGQMAGVTAGQLNEMAAAIKALGAGTQGAAAEALLVLAQAPAIGAENMQRFTAAALRMESVGGQAAQTTLQAFVDLGKEPLKAATKLNETTNFLSASTARQIKLLEDQGRQTDAARVAQEAYARSIEDRTPQMEASLGIIERKWLAIKQAAKGALDGVLSIGRGVAAEDAITQQQAKVDQLRNVTKGGIASPRQFAADLFGTSYADQLRDAEALLAKLKDGVSTQRQLAAATGERATLTREALKWQAEGDGYLDKAVRKERELAAARTEGQRLVQAGLINEGELRDRLAGIEAKYTDKQRTARTGSAADPFAADRAAAKDWQTAYERFSKAAADAQNKVDGLTKSQGLLLEYLQSTAYTNVSEPMRQLALQQAYAAVTAEQAAEEQKAWTKSVADAQGSYAKFIDELERGGDAADRQLQALKDERAATALVVPGLVSLKQAIQLVTIARLEERQATLGYSDEAVAALQREIDMRKQLVDEIGSDEQRAAASKAADDAAKEWRRSADKIETTITDALMRGFESGKGFAAALRDTLVNTFKTTVLRPVISAVINPVAGALTSALGGLFGSSSAAAGSAGASGGAGLLGQASGLAGIGGTLGTLGSYGVTGLMSTLTGTGLGTTLGAAGSLVGSGSIAGGIGLGLGAIAPYAIAALVIANALKSKDAKLGFGASQIGADGSGATAIGRQFGFGNGKDIGAQAELSTISDTIAKSLAAQAKAFGGSAAGLQVQVATDIDRKGKGSGIIAILRDGQGTGPGIQTGGTNSAFQAAVKLENAADLSKFFAESSSAAIISGLKASALPKRMADYFATIDAFSLDQTKANEILAIATGVNSLTTVLNPLGGVFSRLGELGITAANDLAGLVGGLDAFSAKAQSYVQAFYSRDEIAGIKAAEVQTALAAAGITQPVDTKEQFRALVDATDISTQAGREQLATLLNVSSAFSEVAGYLAETNTSLAQAALQAPNAGVLLGLQVPAVADVGPQITAIGAVETAVLSAVDAIRELIDVTRDQGVYVMPEVGSP
jgi:phage-related minor tail protein